MLTPRHQELLYEPSAWGKVFHGLRHNEALGAGSAGPGKTTVLLMNDLDIIDQEHKRCQLKGDDPRRLHWGESVAWILFLRRTLPMLDQTILKASRVFTRIDPSVKWTGDPHFTFVFSSGLRYQFGACKDIGSYERYMSNEYTALNFDELVQFDKEQYDQIKTRLRTSDPLLAPLLRTRAMSNPVMKRGSGETFMVRDPFWARAHFVDPSPQGGKTIKKKVVVRRPGKPERIEWRTRIYLPATLYDNPDPDFVRDYEIQLADSPPHIQQALLWGNWYMTEGSYFGEYWNEAIHTCDPFKIPKGWLRFRSMDWGFKNPGCVHWWALSPDDTLFCERELTFKGRLDYEVAQKVLKIERELGISRSGISEITGPADTQLSEQRGDTGRTKEQVFADNGVVWTRATKDRQRSAELIVTRLRAHKGRIKEPGLVLFHQAQKLKKCLMGIQIDPRDPEVPLDTKNDHWYDSLCYAVAYADGLSGGSEYDDTEDGFSDGDAAVDDDDRGRYGYGRMT